MFGWGKKKEASAGAKRGGLSGPSGPEGEPVIAALLMEQERVDLGTLVEKIRSRAFGGRSAQEIRNDAGIVTFQLGDELVALAPMPSNYPWSDLEGPCGTSWMWPKA